MGARATLESQSFTVKYLFEGSPAEGKLELEELLGICFWRERLEAALGPDLRAARNCCCC